MMRPVVELLRLLAGPRPAGIDEVSVVPIAGAGMLTEVVGGEPPPGASYVARAGERQLLVTPEEMAALREAGAAFDQGTSA